MNEEIEERILSLIGMTLTFFRIEVDSHISIYGPITPEDLIKIQAKVFKAVRLGKEMSFDPSKN